MYKYVKLCDELCWKAATEICRKASATGCEKWQCLWVTAKCIICGCKLWQVPLPGVSDLMTCRVITRSYFQGYHPALCLKHTSYQSSWVKIYHIAQYNACAPVVSYGFNVVYFSATFYFPVSYVGRGGYFLLQAFWMPLLARCSLWMMCMAEST